jgi:hypothetical protein
LANWALASGIVALPVPGVEIVAVVLGAIALNAGDDQPDTAQLTGEQLNADLANDDTNHKKALAGIILGVVAFLLHILAVIAIVLLVLFLPQARQQATPVQLTLPPSAMEGLLALPPAATTPAPPPKRTGQVWYYDLNTGKLFTGRIDDIAPIDAPSGPTPAGQQAGVKAYVFSYGNCSNESERFVAWVERTSVQAKKVVTESRTDPANAGGDLSIDDWIDVLSAPLQISEDATNWRGIHPAQYAQWQLQKRKSLINNGVPASQCEP